jgi:hypothetical protein
MLEPRKAQVEIVELPLYPEDPETIYVSESDVEAIERRLVELGVTRETMAHMIDGELQQINAVLDQEETGEWQLMARMLNFVGLETVVIRASWRNVSDGHWYYGERCIYCNVNVYDADLYGDALCPSSPSITES